MSFFDYLSQNLGIEIHNDQPENIDTQETVTEEEISEETKED